MKCLCLSSFLLQYENVAYYNSCNVCCDIGTGFSVNVLVFFVKHHSVNDTHSFTVPEMCNSSPASQQFTGVVLTWQLNCDSE